MSLGASSFLFVARQAPVGFGCVAGLEGWVCLCAIRVVAGSCCESLEGEYCEKQGVQQQETELSWLVGIGSLLLLPLKNTYLS